MIKPAPFFRLQSILARMLLIGLFICAATGASHAQSTNAAVSVGRLRAEMAARLELPRFSGALWGVKAVSLDSGETLFEHHADRLMSPASNSKLYTGALALDKFGPDYRIATPILATEKADAEGTIHGDLVISGRGDPSWNRNHSGNNFWKLFSPFVTALTNAGVRRVTGDLVGDTTFFHSPPIGSGWSADDLDDSEGAEISALTLNDNFAQIRVTPAARAGEPSTATVVDPFTGLEIDNQAVTVATNVPRHLETRRFRGENTVHIFGNVPVGGQAEMLDMPVLRPADWFVAALKESLKKNGIAVEGAARTVSWPAKPPVATVKIGEVTSEPLKELVRDFMKPSQNLETDLIFAHTGEASRAADAPPWQTSEHSALNALEKFLQNNRLPANEVHFDEGSGLSRNNLTSANATLALLQFMARHKDGAAYSNSLPIAGVDGTLRNRFKGTAAAGNVRAKTGTLRWANALSGYLTTAAGEHLAFSIMLNRYIPSPGHSGREEVDALGLMLANFSGRTGK